MRRGVYLLFLVLLLGSLLLVNSVSAATIEPDVLDQLEENQEVSVIVILKDKAIEESPGLQVTSSESSKQFSTRREMVRKVQDDVLSKLQLRERKENNGLGVQQGAERQNEKYEFELNRRYSIVNGFSGKITKEGLDSLRQNENVEKIIFNTILHPTLDTSAPQINANDVWNLSVGGYNITGAGETICMIDTGIDTDHDAFKDKILNQYCYCSLSGGCCTGSTSEASTAEDDQGHGTHTAGIAAGNLSTYTGIAKDAKIVAIKVCNNASSASCGTDDVISAIEWCTNNATKYNISVISMSLGGGGPYNSYCNTDDTAMTASIDAAVQQNISVVIASGNNGFTNGISFPACVQNATPVGAVNDNDEINYNRGTILEILAPGVSITAPYNTGGTETLSGTSMSTPHVSGAIALLKQYWRLANRPTLSPDEIEHQLTITGKQIDDSSGSGRNYSRLDILAAIDPVAPIVTITNPANDTNFSTGTQAFNATVKELNSGSISVLFSFDNASGNGFNVTPTNVSGNWNTNLNLSRLTDGVHTMTVLANDSAGNRNTTEMVQFRVDTTPPAVSINSPAAQRNFTVASSNQTFNVTVTDATLTIQTVLFSFDNASGNGFNVTAINQSGQWTASYNVSTLVEGPHEIKIFANDTLGNTNFTETITFTLDNTPPAVTFISPSNGSSFTFASGNQTFNATVRDTNLTLQRVLFSFDNASGTGFNVTAVNQSGHWTASYNVSSLADGTHTVTGFANDTAGNINMTETIQFTVDTTTPIVTLNSPGNGFNSSSTSVTFNCSVTDNAGIANVTLYGNWSNGWQANETKPLNGTSNSTTFTKQIITNAGYLWNCLAFDAGGANSFASANFTFTIDTVVPNITSVSAGSPSTTSATITWTTGEKANSTVQYGTTEALGSISSSTAFVTSHSRTLSSLNTGTLYYYNVTSCDFAGNCNTSGGYSFTTASSSDGGGSVGAAGGGGGGGGGGGSTVAVAEAPAGGGAGDEPEAVSSAETPAEEGKQEAEEKSEDAVVIDETTFSGSITVSPEEAAAVKIRKSNIPITEINIKSNVEKTVSLDIRTLSEKPADVTELENVYKFVEITADLTEDDIDSVTVQFTVLRSWLEEQGFSEKTVALQTYEDGWQQLPTKLISKEELLYQAKVDHFSFFAITAQQEKSFLRSLIEFLPFDIGTRGIIMGVLFVVIVILLVIYILLRKKEGPDEL